MPPILDAVVLGTPDQEPARPSRERVAAQSRGAREALSESARLSGAGSGPWKKDAEDAPLPSDGWHWSISHDAWRSAAVVGRDQVGIDVERIEERRDEMVEALISADERRYLPRPEHVDATVFARVWTAKEAVLKSTGIGLGALSRCVLGEALDEELVVLRFDGARCLVRQRIENEHVFAVHTPGDDWSVRWHVAR